MFVAARRLLEAEAALVPLMPDWAEDLLAGRGLSGRDYFDGVILGGGTLIGPAWLARVQAAEALGCPIWTLGTGVGSSGYGDPKQVSLSGWLPLLARMVGIGLRGPRSLETLETLGVADAQVIGDLACEMVCQDAWPIGETPAVMVNVAAAAHVSVERLPTLQAVAAHLQTLVESGVRLVPVAMAPTDVAPTLKVLRLAAVTNAEIGAPSTFEEFARLVGPCRYGIAVRLHASILAGCLGVPTLMLGYREKCLDFMESVGRERFHVPLEEGAAADVFAVLESLENTLASSRGDLLASMKHHQASLRSYANSIVNRC
jgi:polysaccharide pyruvyl transferase WcaK-like protein